MKRRSMYAAVVMLAMASGLTVTGCARTADVPEAVSEEAVREEAETEEAPAEAKSEEPEETVPDTEGKAHPAGRLPQLMVRSESAYETAEDGTLLLSGKVRSPLLTEESAADYPALAKVLEDAANLRQSSYEAESSDLVEGAREWYGESPESFEYMYYSDNWDVAPQRIDTRVVSFYFPYDEYTGGAHGMYGKSGVTYDAATGKELALSDVISDLSALSELIKQELLKDYDPEFFDDLDEALSAYDVSVTDVTEDPAAEYGYTYPYNWALTPAGIDFYFGPYSLAAYAAGAQEIVLGYEEYPEIFEAAYLPESAQSMMVPFTYSMGGYDIDGDGTEDTVTIDAEYGENYEDGITGLGIIINEKEPEKSFTDIWLSPDYDMTAYYIRLSDGAQYIYVFADEENDYRELFVFALQDGSAVPVDIRGFVRSILAYHEEDGTFDELLLTNPEDMSLSSRFDILSTFSASRTYHVGDDGMPAANEEVYTINWDAAQEPFVAKTELDCEIVDESGAVVSTGETIGVGDTFTNYRTDAKTYLDVLLSDGRIARLRLTRVDYPCEIDGIKDTDCVEEIWYAG